VEAARRSGAVSTASRALELGRVVMAVPGPITSMASTGTNRLLHEEVARAVSDSAEVAALLRGSGLVPEVDGGGPAPADGLDHVPLAGLPVEARSVLEALPRRGARSVEAAAERAGISPAACLAHLGLLEISGLARRSASGWGRCR
jgi:DNA processing protein